MIRLKVQQAARSRGITTIKDLAQRANLAYDTAADFWHDRMKRLDLSTFERVCRTLQVEPGEVIGMIDD